MTEKRIIFILLIVGLVLITLGFSLLFYDDDEKESENKSIDSHSNVVIIVMDAFRADRVGYTRNNIPLTPFLDSLASQSAIFTSAVTPCTWTRPAMASLYTSLYTDTHQIYYGAVSEESEINFSDILVEELVNIGDYFKGFGFTTLALQTNGLISANFGFDKGFDTYAFYDAIPGEETTDKALELLDETSNPFLLYVHYMDTHSPYNPPEKYLKLVGYDVSDLNANEQQIVIDFNDYFWDFIKYKVGINEVLQFSLLSSGARDAILARYDAEVRYTDDQVRRLVTSIQAKCPNTIFVITADHGEHFWEHDYLGHGLTLYNSELKVPLFIFGTNIGAGYIEKAVDLTDILPTLANLLNFPVQKSWQGKDMFDSTLRPVFSHTHGGTAKFNISLDMVLHNNMKLLVDNKRNTFELYDWLKDPKEKNNLSKQNPEILHKMHQLITNHRKKCIRERCTQREGTELDPEMIEQMRRLGYME